MPAQGEVDEFTTAYAPFRIRHASGAVSATPTVAVIGGGVIGLSCARELALAGADVTVYDRPHHGRPSDVAAGMLAPTCELDYGEVDLHHLTAESLALWPGFAASLERESAVDVGLRPEGTLVLAADPDERARLDRRARHWDEHGLSYRRLTGRECRQCEPALSRRVLAGLEVDTDLSVDNRAVMRALRNALEPTGVRFVDALAEPVRDGDVVRAVRSPDGEQAVDVVVLAAGVWSGALADAIGLDPPLRPMKGQQLRVHSPDEIIRRTIRARVDEVDIYLVPRRDGTIVVGGTSEDVGLDLRRTPRAAMDLLTAACALVPELRDVELIEHGVGLRPATTDNQPLIGRTGLPGLILATGHFRHGFLLAPVTAAAVRAAVLDEPLPTAALPFSPSRDLLKENATP